MQKITPFLWFDHQAEEAMDFYTSIFKDSEVFGVSRYPEGTPVPAGTVMTASFRLLGQEFIVLNGGPEFKFTEAISFVVHCDTAAEVDELWAKLTEGGEEGRCGWLKDKYGLSWQIVPRLFDELMSDEDPVKVQKVMQAMLKMNKLDSAKLMEAYQGKS